ncbi:MAG: hypothetical protein JSV05_05355 [Candidatus Bathyarchaeota archaeon]|nr:MAG: hypothetical protein JSV05_05355 [Candidatus Bathyarchaeota archaeon]
MKTEILDIDYNGYVNLLGTAHFTRRSLMEACEAVQMLEPTDLAIELDLQRFQFLNRRCFGCPDQAECSRRCEFVGATDALGNVSANIWLIDMSEREISERIRRLLPYSRNWWFSMVTFAFWPQLEGDRDKEVLLWEKGYKEEVLKQHTKRLEVLRAKSPHLWRVLIDERNTLMAARLAWIVTQNLKAEKEVRVLALTGAAHVKGIAALLGCPAQLGEELRRLRLKFTSPQLIRRVSVN